jgi:uncharacterized membrane protein YqaE (UPF0057 family)
MNKILKISLLIATFIFMLSETSRAVERNQSVDCKENTFTSVQTIPENPAPANMEIQKLSFKEKIQLSRKLRKEIKAYKKNNSDVPEVVLYILAVVLPPLAVGLYTNWGEPTLWNLLFTILMWLPGVIHAFYILLK